MESEKRKRRADAGESDGRKTKAVLNENGIKPETTVTESEVEEFYAIMRRIHVAVTYFKKGNGKESMMWSQLPFELENFDKVNGGEEREGGEKILDFDLNADPVDEPDLSSL